MSLTLSTAALTVFLLAGNIAMANEYFLSPSGNDSQAGSIGQPWLTFVHAVSQLAGGDTLNVRGGTYAQRLILNGKSGTASAPIVIRPFADENAIIDGTSLTVPTGGRAGLVAIIDCDYVTLSDLAIRNFKTTQSSRTPVGIQIEGSGDGTAVCGCTVSGIWQSSTSISANGFGIAVYGTKSTPLANLILENNIIRDLRTGQSESVVINGNVTGFQVLRNHVYDCNNIGIDFIGYEGSAPAAVDRARDGVCRENIVHDIDSAFNPGYGGNFITGGGDQSAAGIYVDGGTNIVIDRNHVYRCNFGIELASENAAGFTDHIVMRDNLLDHNFGPGIIMGGYDSNRGTTRFCEVRNNTIYQNDSRQTYGGQIALQFYLKNNQFTNNIIWADPMTKQMIIHYVEGGTAAQRAFDKTTNRFDHNIYFSAGSAGDIEFGLNSTGTGGSGGNKSYNGLAAWRAAIGGDASSAFGNPGFVTPAPGATPTPPDFQLTASSFARDRGEPSPPFAPAPGELDFGGASRVANGRVDGGMDEYLDTLQSWRDLYFKLPDGGPGAGDNDDPDFDGFDNLIEFSQGMNPTLSDPSLGPSGEIVDDIFRFTYRKEALGLTYQIETSGDMVNWSPAAVSEQLDASGNHWREFPLVSETPFFVRFNVSR